MTENNNLALKRDQLIEAISNSYADTYGAWLANQSTDKQIRIARKSESIKRGGVATIGALTCYGPKRCPFFHACPIPSNVSKPGLDSEYPINLPCVLEVEYIAQQVVSYCDQLKVDPQDIVEMSLINELAFSDLVKNRAILILSGGDSKGQGRDLLAVDEQIIGWSPDGDA